MRSSGHLLYTKLGGFGRPTRRALPALLFLGTRKTAASCSPPPPRPRPSLQNIFASRQE
jgi:hypothetical protein